MPSVFAWTTGALEPVLDPVYMCVLGAVVDSNNLPVPMVCGMPMAMLQITDSGEKVVCPFHRSLDVGVGCITLYCVTAGGILGGSTSDFTFLSLKPFNMVVMSPLLTIMFFLFATQGGTRVALFRFAMPVWYRQCGTRVLVMVMVS